MGVREAAQGSGGAELMIETISAAVALAAALAATFVGDVRKAILALWIAGIGVGGLYLSIGAELLAVVQWVISTLVAIAFIFYGVMYGELGAPDSRPIGKRLTEAVLPVLIGGSFAGVVWLGMRALQTAPRAVAEGASQADQGMAA